MVNFSQTKSFSDLFFENGKTLSEEMTASADPFAQEAEGDSTRISKNRREIPDSLLSYSDTFEAGQFKTLRTRLLFPSGGKKIRSVGITSPSFGEGKTYICSKLGLSIAQNVDGKHAVLVDVDIRRSNLHKLFGFGEDTPGLSDYLLGSLPLSDVLLKPYNQNLLLLPGGRRADNPSELLSSKKMLDLLEELYARHDDRYVLVDLPSPQLVPEADVIAQKLDGIIIVARAGKTPADQVGRLAEWVGKDKVIGVVLNRFDTSLHSSLFRMYRRFIRRK